MRDGSAYQRKEGAATAQMQLAEALYSRVSDHPRVRVLRLLSRDVDGNLHGGGRCIMLDIHFLARREKRAARAGSAIQHCATGIGWARTVEPSRRRRRERKDKKELHLDRDGSDIIVCEEGTTEYLRDRTAI